MAVDREFEYIYIYILESSGRAPRGLDSSLALLHFGQASGTRADMVTAIVPFPIISVPARLHA